MRTTERRAPLYKRLQASLEEGISFAQNELDLRTTEVPTKPPKVSAKEIAQLRRSLGMSQGVFAQMLNVSAKTVHIWEQGERTPAASAIRLLQVLKAKPELVCEIARVRQR